MPEFVSARLRTLQALAFLTPVVAVVAPLGMAPLFALACLAIIWLARQSRPWRTLPRGMVATVAGLVMWGLLSAGWSDDPLQSLKGVTKMGATILGGLLLVTALAGQCEGRAGALARALMIGAGISLVVLDAEFLTGNRVSYLIRLIADPQAIVPFKSTLSRGATVLTLLLWPLALLVVRRWGRVPAIILVTATLAIFAMGESISSRLAVSVAVGAFALVYLNARLGVRLMKVALVVAAAATPIAAASLPAPQETAGWRWLPDSAHHRLTIWNFTARRALEHPFRGWGMDASRWMPGADDEIRVTRWHEGTVMELVEPQLPLHPHNSILQWWLELGVPGMALVVAFLWRVLTIIGRLPVPAERAAAAAMFAAGGAVSLVSYGFWQSWWQGGMWLSTVIFASIITRPEACNCGRG